MFVVHELSPFCNDSAPARVVMPRLDGNSSMRESRRIPDKSILIVGCEAAAKT